MANRRSARRFSVRRYVLNCVESKETESDWTFDAAVEAGAVTIGARLPRSKDLRAPW
jgi:hypothetical protein